MKEKQTIESERKRKEAQFQVQITNLMLGSAVFST